MKLYLVQHGLAKSKDEDPERPLTADGGQAVERVGAWASRDVAQTAPATICAGTTPAGAAQVGVQGATPPVPASRHQRRIGRAHLNRAFKLLRKFS